MLPQEGSDRLLLEPGLTGELNERQHEEGDGDRHDRVDEGDEPLEVARALGLFQRLAHPPTCQDVGTAMPIARAASSVWASKSRVP